jgi:hypothetical protein
MARETEQPIQPGNGPRVERPIPFHRGEKRTGRHGISGSADGYLTTSLMARMRLLFGSLR